MNCVVKEFGMECLPVNNFELANLSSASFSLFSTIHYILDQTMVGIVGQKHSV